MYRLVPGVQESFNETTLEEVWRTATLDELEKAGITEKEMRYLYDTQSEAFNSELTVRNNNDFSWTTLWVSPTTVFGLDFYPLTPHIEDMMKHKGFEQNVDPYDQYCMTSDGHIYRLDKDGRCIIHYWVSDYNDEEAPVYETWGLSDIGDC